MIKSGVYTIINRRTNKQYIGSTSNLYCRKRDHFYNLRRNKHPNRHLQNAYNKQPEQFYWHVVEHAEPSMIAAREQFWIDAVKFIDGGQFYNIQESVGEYNRKRKAAEGCSWCKQHQRWRAYVRKDYIQIGLGYYDTKQEAIDAYQTYLTDGLIPVLPRRSSAHYGPKKGAKGFYQMKPYNKWRAEARKDGRKIYLGIYDTEAEAQAARQNFVDNGIIADWKPKPPVRGKGKDYHWSTHLNRWRVYGRSEDGELVSLGSCLTEDEAKQIQTAFLETGINPKRVLKGYFWCKSKRKWRTRVMRNGKKVDLGCYSLEAEAAAAVAQFIETGIDPKQKPKGYYKRKDNAWQAEVTRNGKRTNLGRHKTEAEAAAAYQNFINNENQQQTQ